MAVRYRSSFAKVGEDAKRILVDKVAQLGQDAIKYAFEKGFRSRSRNYSSKAYHNWLVKKGKDPNRAWDDITGNLRDSFGSAVYINGELQPHTIRYANETPIGRDTTNGVDGRSGREALNDYLRSIHPNQGKNEITLVCVAAMYYTRFLERGTHAGHYKIRVVSAATDYIKRNWERAVDGVYKELKIKKPASRVIRGNIQPLRDIYNAYE